MAENSIPIRTALMPLYYKNFHCIMGACQDNCCDDGWLIEFNKKDYLAIKRAPKSPELQALMAEGLSRLRERAHDTMYAELKVTPEGRCCFHGEDGLCRLQMECGEAVLPKVCRIFPRRIQYTLAAREYSLSPACEGVLAQLWDLPEGIDFWEEPLPEKDCERHIPKNPVAARFAEIRSLCIDVLQERTQELPRRLLLLGFLLQQLQKVDWETGEGVDAWLARGELLLHDQALAEELKKLPGNKAMFLSQNTRILVTLLLEQSMRKSLFRELWSSIMCFVPTEEGRTATFDIQRYEALEKKLEELPGLGEYFFENLMVNAAFYMAVPALDSPEDVWKSYVHLCSLYSLYRFAAVCGCGAEVSRERLFRVLVSVSRSILHNPSRRDRLRDELFKNDSATLAHMAILVNG